jgi:(1->4)-alpha-D-glucan 1-alpha-D-glucosylmutase
VDALTNVLLDEDREIAIRFQQFTSAVMAKGVENTAFYRWNRFIALNEVGGAPDRFGVAPEEFHVSAAAYPDTSMTTLSTHDTKRGEDVRARLAVLSELAPAWHDQAAVWSARYPLGDPDFESLLWQTAVGAWPIARERLHAYAETAARAAATSTTWAEPNLVFEDRMHAVIDAMYDDDYLSETLTDFATEITPAGWSNSLGQKLVQLTMPGVPDVYQGSELWDNWLVDPDNRRPVDFAERADLLGDLDAGMLPPVDATGAAKLLVTSRALRLRRDRPDLFTGYTPVRASGPNAQHVVAFDRGGAVTVVTRLPVRLAMAGGWTADDRLDLHDGPWRDALTGASGARDIAKLLGRYPVALLAREAS